MNARPITISTGKEKMQLSSLPARKIMCNLAIRLHHRPATPVPRGQQNAAVPAFMLNVLQPADEVGYTTKAEAETDDRSPSTTLQSAMVKLSSFPTNATHFVVPPLWCSVRVKALIRQAGQSTGAAVSARFASGMAVWYPVCDGCCICCN